MISHGKIKSRILREEFEYNNTIYTRVSDIMESQVYWYQDQNELFARFSKGWYQGHRAVSDRKSDVIPFLEQEFQISLRTSTIKTILRK
jgi:hypothetical protein